MVVSDYGNDDGDGDVDGVNDCDEVVMGHRFDPELDRINEPFRIMSWPRRWYTGRNNKAVRRCKIVVLSLAGL